jgi:(p)ppGpp synthase/HD superfamily hydrolase
MTYTSMLEWAGLEKWLVGVAHGRLRKNDEPMVNHWLRIGRALREQGADAITVCGGYGHDLVEDVPELPVEDISHAFEAVLHSTHDAALAVQLVHDCSYQPEEYRLEGEVAASNGHAAGKAARKSLACARWLSHPDPRVHAVKVADVDDNDATCESVSSEFALSYRSWARPLREGLLQNVAASPRAP